MINKTIRIELLTLLMCVLPSLCFAQERTLQTVQMDSTIQKLNQMTVEDYKNLVFPPLAELYDNARQANAVQYFAYEAEYYESDIKTERRKPLEWIKGVATYSYGNTDMAAISLMETTYQIWTQNQVNQRNTYYNVGAMVNIPLIDIFNTRNKVKQAKAKVNQTKAREESELDEIRKDIVDLYCTVIEKINALDASSKRLVTAQGQYNFIENDFVNNKVNAEDLYRSRDYLSTATEVFEQIKRELNVTILTLEIVSCTPIVTNYTPISMR